MNPPKSYQITFLMLLTMLMACESTKTAKDSEPKVENEQTTEYPGGEETIEPYSGYIDGVYRLFSGLGNDQNSSTQTIGKVKWTYERLYKDAEVAFVEFQTTKSLHKIQFGLENDTLVYAEEMETLLPLQHGDSWTYSYVIFKDTVVAFMAESTGDLQAKSEAVKTAEIFKIWQSHRANFNKVKASLGFDGIKDVAAMEIYENFQLNNDTYIGKYMDADSPLKITISYGDEAMEDKVILYETEEEKRKFFINDHKSRGDSRLVSTHGNKAVFELLSSHPQIYLQELVFSDERVLLEIKLRDILED